MSRSRSLIVGIGSPHGDDLFGWRVVEMLSAEHFDDAELRAARSPVELLDWLDGVERLIVCDACRGIDRPGVVRRWSWPAAELERIQWSGTHDLGLCIVLELAEQLGRLPPNMTLWSVQAGTVDRAAATSAAVDAAVDVVVRGIRRQLQSNELNRCMRCHWSASCRGRSPRSATRTTLAAQWKSASKSARSPACGVAGD